MSKTTEFHPLLRKTIQQLTSEFEMIPNERRAIVRELAEYVKSQIKKGKNIELVFICTHNSRRSHISQIWAQTAAAHYGVGNVASHSGGTEATAFNPRAVTAMESVGFQMRKNQEGDNPIYRVFFDPNANPIVAYSKRYDAESNPKAHFAAIMTCSHADENCPVIFGMEKRIALPYDDPKDFDGTPIESEKYLERVMEIGREILFAFSLVDK